jgi:hypothetical protein
MAVPVEELITFINDVPPEKRAPIIAQTARLMGPMLNGEPRNLNGVSAIVKLLQRLDPQSGHAYYFCGEVARKLKPKELPTDYECFFSYLAYEKTLSPEAKSGKAARCYEREQGYCEERTGWICHLLANDLYKIPKEMSSFSDMKDRLQKAAIYAQCALDNYPPKGFTQLTPTVELQGKINAALKAL